ncbi:MAG: CotH kinase family protein, partial [Patescibacteria group bacterium]
MNIYYYLKKQLYTFFRNLTFKKIAIIILTLFFLILVGTRGLLYIEKRNWDNRVGELNYSLNFFTYIPNATNILNFYKQFLPSKLSKYELKISDESLKKLEEAFPDDFFGNLPKKSVWAEAEFYDDGKKYEVEIKNRGLMSRHWRYRKKSWHIKFKDEYWNGYQEINFILPEEKDFLVEDYGYHVAEKLGLVGLETSFVRLKINSQSYGAYWMIEHWNENFLERNQLSSDADLYRKDQGAGDIYKDSFNLRKYTEESHSVESNYAGLDILLNCLQDCSDEEFYQTAKRMIDMDNFLAWQSHASLLGDDHQYTGHNIRLYFNSVKGKFQFFPVDVNQFKFDGQLDIHYNTLMSRLLMIPEVMGQRNQILWGYVNDKDNIQDDIDYYEDLYKQTKSAFYKDKTKRYSNLYFNYRVKDRFEKMKKQYEYIKDLLASETEIKIRYNNFTDKVSKINIQTQNFSDIKLEEIAIEDN